MPHSSPRSGPRRSPSRMFSGFFTPSTPLGGCDGLKWFNWLYLQVTQAVEARVGAGAFHDPEGLPSLTFNSRVSTSRRSGPRCPGKRRRPAGRSRSAIAASPPWRASSSRWLASTPISIATFPKPSSPPVGQPVQLRIAAGPTTTTTRRSTRRSTASSTRPNAPECPASRRGPPTRLSPGRHPRRLERGRRAGVGLAKRRASLAAPSHAAARRELHGHVGRLHHRDRQDPAGAGAMSRIAAAMVT